MNRPSPQDRGCQGDKYRPEEFLQVLFRFLESEYRLQDSDRSAVHRAAERMDKLGNRGSRYKAPWFRLVRTRSATSTQNSGVNKLRTRRKPHSILLTAILDVSSR